MLVTYPSHGIGITDFFGSEDAEECHINHHIDTRGKKHCNHQWQRDISVSKTINYELKDCTKITEVNLSAFAYRLFHEDFSLILGAKCGPLSTLPLVIPEQIWIILNDCNKYPTKHVLLFQSGYSTHYHNYSELIWFSKLLKYM